LSQAGRSEETAPKGVFIYVAGRTCLCALLAFAALAIGCPAALAANQTVIATNTDVFSPSSVTITQGDTVTWSNEGLHPHNVHFEEFAFVEPSDPFATNNWSVFHTFTQGPGTYHYYCEVHQVDGMTGTVIVNPPSSGGGGGGGGGGGTPGPGPADTAPVSSLISASKQDVDKLSVRASMNEAGTLTATGTVNVGGAAKAYNLKRASRTVAAGQSVKLRLKLSKKALRAVKRAIRHKRKARAKVTLTALDTTGHKTVRKQTIRLKR
jgi:plastocyanin